MFSIKTLYTASEEYNPIVVDQFDRFRSYLSNNPYKLEPLISRFLYREGFRPVYKGGKKYAICISHDVDIVYDRRGKKAALMSSLRSLKNRDLSKFTYDLKMLGGPMLNPDLLLEQLIDVEVKHGFPATYYFLAINPNEPDFNYHIDQMKPYFEKIKNAGGEIGLHGGHEAYNSLEKIRSERTKLENAWGQIVTGYRNHFLRFKTPQTWEHLAALGFMYDTTFGYADLPGYRNGMCYPFRPFNNNTNSFIDILELPLVIMDCSFWKYMGLNLEQSLVIFKKIVEDVKAVNGVLTILWHNHCLMGDEGVLYNKIIDYLVKDEEAWFSTSHELAQHWKENNLPVMEGLIKDNFDSFIPETQNR